jgi:hypothetical protein
MFRFDAPWGKSLKWMTGLTSVILLGLPVIGTLTGPGQGLVWSLGIIIIPMFIFLIGLFFMIRGYVLTEDTLFVRRLGWNSKLDLNGLKSAEADPKAMTGSIRTFGNGGLFCFAGRFRNRKLGPYRALVTDPHRAVVLKFDKNVIVVTPDDPGAFVNRIKALIKLQEGE